LTGRDERRTEKQDAYLSRLCAQDAEIATTYRLVRGPTGRYARRSGELLEGWLADVLAGGCAELQRFARGVQADQTAVQAGLTDGWSQGQVEGQINRLKYMKRQMYGRAGFGLLQQRVLQRPAPPRRCRTPEWSMQRYMALVSTKSDTAGEVVAAHVAGIPAIKRTNGVCRVFGRGISRNHSPSRRKLIAVAVSRCPRWVRASPIYGLRRKRDVRTPREIVPSIPARRAYSLWNACVPSRCRAACSASCCRSGRMVSVRRGYFFLERTHCVN